MNPNNEDEIALLDHAISILEEEVSVKTILTNRAYIGDTVQGKVKQELCNGLPKQYIDKGA